MEIQGIGVKRFGPRLALIMMARPGDRATFKFKFHVLRSRRAESRVHDNATAKPWFALEAAPSVLAGGRS